MTWMVLPDKPWAVSTVDLPESALVGVQGWQKANINGQNVTIVPHDYNSWRVLRDSGLLVPAPTNRFDWPGPKDPMQHQSATTDFLIEHDKAFCLNGLRTGKTLSALWGAEYLLQVGDVKRVLVVCPKFLMDIVWERELLISLPHRKRALLTGSRRRKRMIASDKRLEFIVVNPESLHLVVDCLDDVGLIIVDEFTTFKSVYVGAKRSIRYDALKRAARHRRLWMLSATPAPQYPSDAYGPIRLVNPEYITLTAFRDMTMMKVSETKWVPRFGAKDIIAQWMQPAIRFKREDCIDIPDEEIAEVECGLSKEQKKVLGELARKAKATLSDGTDIRAIHAAATSLKILQVMAGGVYGEDPEGERATYSVNAEPYLETVEGLIREEDGPVIVFVSFQCSVDVLADYLEKKGLSVGRLTRSKAILNGKKVKSMVLFDAFQLHGTVDAIVADPRTMRYGLELTRCRMVLWASPPYSYETYDQASARVKGASQERKVMILHLIQNELSKVLFRRLKERENFQDSVLDAIEAMIGA